jgi:hypothetical protein
MTARAVAKLDGDSFNAAKALEIGLIDQIQENQKMTDKVTPELAVDKTNNSEPMAAVFTQAQVNDMIAAAATEAAEKARKEATEAANAYNERMRAVNALEAPDEVKALFGSEKYQAVAIEDMQALVAAMPKSATVLLNEQGGAGVGVDRLDFAPKSNETEIADRQAQALENLKGKGSVL